MKELNFQEYLEALAEEAKTNMYPWLAFEVRRCEQWQECENKLWGGSSVRYRRKPRTVTRTITLPVGLSAVKHGQKCWFADWYCVQEFSFSKHNESHVKALRAGFLYASAEEAIAAANAILGVGDE